MQPELRSGFRFAEGRANRFLALSIILSGCAARAGAPGSAAPVGTTVTSSTPTETAGPAASASPSASPPPLPGAAPTAGPSAVAPNAQPLVPESPVVMKPPVTTALAGELQAIGLDPEHLPPLEKIDAKELRGVMKLFARSLGERCTFCHEEGDYAANTPKKNIAAKMWDEYAVKLEMDDGSPLFCDSCHAGRTKVLDRADAKALSDWMDANYVAKLKQRSGADQKCETCHVDMDMHFLNKWSER